MSEPTPLERAARAIKARRRADEQYQQAVRDAIAEGRSAGEIARAAGVSRQSVWELARRQGA